MEKTLEEQANWDAYQSSLIDDWELRAFGDFDSDEIMVDHYDGTR